MGLAHVKQKKAAVAMIVSDERDFGERPARDSKAPYIITADLHKGQGTLPYLYSATGLQNLLALKGEMTHQCSVPGD